MSIVTRAQAQLLLKLKLGEVYNVFDLVEPVHSSMFRMMQPVPVDEHILDSILYVANAGISTLRSHSVPDGSNMYVGVTHSQSPNPEGKPCYIVTFDVKMPKQTIKK